MEQATVLTLVAAIAALIIVGFLCRNILAKRNEILKNAEKVLDEAQRNFEKSKAEAEEIIGKANLEKEEILEQAEKEVIPFAERIERLKVADGELVARLKKARKIVENITDKCCTYAANIDLLNENDLATSPTYQKQRKEVKRNLSRLAKDAIVGVRGGNSNVNIGKFVAISAKADMAGALSLTTVEMLCAKCTHNNAHQAIERLAESILATEALVKCIDSRATINEEFESLLKKRLEIEINYKKAKQLAKEQQRELREQQREERKAREEAEMAEREAEREEEIKKQAIAELERAIAEQSEAEKEAHESELKKLREELEDIHSKLERARSRAQDTRQGHVYIISNIGSFGKEILKIGMTRRLDPMDRVKELGDASVPFSFDVHALIECDDAPLHWKISSTNTLRKAASIG